MRVRREDRLVTDDADRPTSGSTSGETSGRPEDDWLDHAGVDEDVALARLEELLQALPYDRALPPLEVILERAGIPEELLRRDDRVLKVLHEAIVARPFGHLDEVAGARTEIELLTLEVELLTDRLADRDADADTVARASVRLTAVRERLHEVRDLL